MPGGLLPTLTSRDFSPGPTFPGSPMVSVSKLFEGSDDGPIGVDREREGVEDVCLWSAGKELSRKFEEREGRVEELLGKPGN